jgi:hypothetical protein
LHLDIAYWVIGPKGVGLMEGVHEGTKHASEHILGSPAVARAQRERSQTGVAAEGRKANRVAAATRLDEQARAATTEESEVAAEVARALKQGTALVQASLAHLADGERLWERWVKKSGAVFDGFPAVEQVVTFMAVQSRERQHACLAQRGDVRKGLQREVVRNYVAEMGNNLWATKFPSFGALDRVALSAYWGKIFGAYKAMYAGASAAPGTGVSEERAAQLVAQTEEICKRKHIYRTEVWQLQARVSE